MSIDHYENFPVASWLCPAALRGAVTAIYHFARTADDIADEGNAAPEQRQADLARYRLGLQAAAAGAPLDGAWPAVFHPLAAAISRHQLPVHRHDVVGPSQFRERFKRRTVTHDEPAVPGAKRES